MSLFNQLPCDLFIVIVNIMGLTLWFLVKVISLAYINGELWMCMCEVMCRKQNIQDVTV